MSMVVEKEKRMGDWGQIREVPVPRLFFFFASLGSANSASGRSGHVGITTAHAYEKARDKRWPNFQDGVSESSF